MLRKAQSRGCSRHVFMGDFIKPKKKSMSRWPLLVFHVFLNTLLKSSRTCDKMLQLWRTSVKIIQPRVLQWTHHKLKDTTPPPTTTPRFSQPKQTPGVCQCIGGGISGQQQEGLVWVKMLTKPHSFSSMVMDLSSIWVKTSMTQGTLLATSSITEVPSANSMSRCAYVWNCWAVWIEDQISPGSLSVAWHGWPLPGEQQEPEAFLRWCCEHPLQPVFQCN